MRKKNLFLTLGLSALMAFCGCGGDPKEKDSETALEMSQQNAASSKEETTVETTVETTREITEETTPVVYKKGESITVVTHDSVLIEGDYEVTVALSREVYNGRSIEILVYHDGKQSSHHYTVMDDYTLAFDYDRVVPEFMIEIEKANDEEVTLVFSDRTYPEPLKLSGNPQDIYDITEYQYVVGERAVLFMDKGLKISGDTMKLIDLTINELESLTGLQFNNSTVYSGLCGYGEREDYWRGDPWNGYNSYPLEKLNIYYRVNRTEESLISYAMNRYIVMMDDSIDYHTDSLNTLAHELAHVLAMANFDELDRVLTEGYGAYWARQVSMRHPEVVEGGLAPWGPDTEEHWAIEHEITAENAKEQYLQEFDRALNDDYYDIGFRLYTYLYETYGLNETHEFLNKLSERLMKYRFEESEYAEYAEAMLQAHAIDCVSSAKLEADFIEAYFGEDFFSKFGAWVDQNKHRFAEIYHGDEE